MKKLIRITTVPQSLRGLLKGQLKFMKSHGYEVLGVSSPGEALEDVAKNETVEVYPVRMTREITPIADLKALVKLYFLFKREKPFIVHTHTPKAGLLGMIAAKLANVPNRLHTVAGLPLTVSTGFKRKLLERMEVLTYKCATKVFPNSYGLMDIITNNNLSNKKKLKVIGNGSSNGIDTSIFDPYKISFDEQTELKKSLGIKTSDFVFLFVGRIVKDKGIHELIDSFIKVNQLHKNVKLLLVGSIHDNNSISEKYKNIIKKDKDIISVGVQRNVLPFYSISDAFVFPSYREGFPNVVMEACAMNLPSIVTNINGCNEIIKNEENGLIIEPYSVEDTFTAMNLVYSNISLYNKLKSNSRDSIQRKYERSFVWGEILNEYKKLDANV